MAKKNKQSEPSHRALETAIARPAVDGLALSKDMAESKKPEPARSLSTSQLDSDVRHLAALSPLAYEQCRSAEAERLGVRLAVLDGEVAPKRPPSNRFGEPEPFLAETELYPEPVDGLEVLHEVTHVVQRYVVLNEDQAVTVALWIAFAHAHDVATHSPILAVESPEKRCGKSTLLNVIAALVPKALPIANITMAALFRTIEKYRPTLLIDEADTFIRKSDELRGLLNSGHFRPLANVVRTVGQDFEPQTFSTWAPKATALIGELPGTLQDRAILIRLRRKLPSERVERFRDGGPAVCRGLNAKLARWVHDHQSGILGRRPEIPDGLNDRAADSWSLLFAIADELGGDWPELAHRAALSISGEGTNDEGCTSTGAQLLADIRSIFEAAGVTTIPSLKLAENLAELEEAPWGEWYGRPITPRFVARHLKSYNIRPRKERNANVYHCRDFEEAWARYVDGPAGTSPTSSKVLNFEDFWEGKSSAETNRVEDTKAIKSTQFQLVGRCGG
jgi:putative DNA primase/helicase